MAQLKSGSTAGGQVIATRDWVTSNLIDSAPAALDTLNELAAALGDDPNFATTMTNALAGKLSTGHDMTLSLAGDASGSATFTNMGNATLTVAVANDSHTHDGRYYTETEVNSLLSGKLSTSGKAADSHLLDGIDSSGFVKAYSTSNANIDDDWGQSFKTFDPIPSGNPPIQSPNLRTINVGNNFDRRTQLAFNYSTDQAWFRRRHNSTWHDWKEFYHTGNLSLATLGYTGATNANYITNNNQLTNGAGYIVKSSTQDPGTWPNATKFKSSGAIADSDSGSHSLQVISDNNNDAFMAFHISSDYAVFLGLDGGTNRLHTGGWSAGNNQYMLWDSRDFSSTNISNWNTAYNNHITGISITGTTTKTITLTQNDGGTISNTFTDLSGAGGDGNDFLSGGSFDGGSETLTLEVANQAPIQISLSGVMTDNNTWRGIHDSPVDGATTTSISSNWAFDNVKTAVPANAVFTDNNTTYSVGDGGLTQKNFTTTLKNKLDALDPSNYGYETMNAQAAISGGGNVTWNGTNLSWSARIIMIPVDKTLGSSGHLDINAQSIAIPSWSALYYKVNRGQSSTYASAQLVVLPYSGTGVVVEDGWILVATRNNDNGSIKWLPGQVNIPSGGTYYSSSGACSWQPDTNTTYSVGDGGLTQKNFTTTLKNKLDGIAASANNYSHPTGAGNKHIPSGGSSGQFLKYTSSGTAVWATPSYTTNTNTQLSQTEVIQMFTGGTNVSIDAAGVISSTDTNTTYSVFGSANGLVPGHTIPNNIDQNYYLNGAGSWSIPPDTNTDTNTTYTAGAGLDLSGTTFSIESDLRDGITRIGKDTSNYIAIDADNNNSIDFYISGVWVARMEADGDLHMKGDVVAFSDIFNP